MRLFLLMSIVINMSFCKVPMSTKIKSTFDTIIKQLSRFKLNFNPSDKFLGKYDPNIHMEIPWGKNAKPKGDLEDPTVSKVSSKPVNKVERALD